jgi:N-acetyl sugar amidotransferase
MGDKSTIDKNKYSIPAGCDGCALIQRCSKCTMPETHETIVFDGEGVCNICKQHEVKNEKIDWEARAKEFADTIEEYRGKYSYDCIVPFSGGKDSTFVLYEMVKTYKVKPLVVSFDHGFYRPLHLKNREEILTKLGVDFLSFRPNMQIVKKLMIESLRRKGDWCWHCHTGIFSWPMQIAIKYNVPLLIWGESTAEYTSYYDFDEVEEQDEEAFNKYINLGITAEDMAGMVDDPNITARDLEPYTYPKLKDLKAINYKSICYGTSHQWDVRKQVKLIKDELGFESDKVEGIPDQYGFTKRECNFNGVRDYLKYIKRGFGRTTQLTTDDIRAGVMDRETAVELIKANDGKKPASLKPFLDFIKMGEEEFNEIAKSHAVSPWKVDPVDLPEGDKLPDQDEWIYSKNNDL